MSVSKTIKVQGMTCEHCVNAVQKAILKLDNTAKVNVDLKTGLVSVDTMQPRETLIAAVKDAGYEATAP
ncbi:heavy-metal-associated domain-containing protein [Lampropedia cohaerens]|uniref:heavy-metal-associated domain-containing protein n=1 Tax=Lampropedia cohaerens TaxID=1610491 RepID=UPI001E28417E|nr:cation transporter [Lampropedia cohaerens]